MDRVIQDIAYKFADPEKLPDLWTLERATPGRSKMKDLKILHPKQKDFGQTKTPGLSLFL